MLDALGIEHAEHAFGGNAILAQGDPLPDDTLAACRTADAVLLGAVGLPELEGRPVRPEQGLLGLRRELGVYANLRPASADGIDLVIVRELVGGLYFGAKGTRDDGTWFDTCEYSRPEVERIARRAFEIARERGGRLTSVDKVNVLHTSRLWREVVSELGEAEYPDVPLDHALVDSFAMTDRQRAGDDRRRRHREHLRRHPLGRRRGGHRRPRCRGIGLARGRRAGLFEPVHGSRRRSPARESRTPPPCSARPRSCSATGSGARTRPRLSSGRSTRACETRRRPTSEARPRPRGMGDAVLQALEG